MTITSAGTILPLSMLLRSDQFRSLVIILVIVAIPFCCCNFRSLLGGNSACHNPLFSEESLVSASPSQAKDHAPPAVGCCRGKSLAESGISNWEPTNDPSDQPRDCSCDKGGGKMLSVEKPALELPAQVAVVALEWAQWPELRTLSPVSGRGHLSPAVHRPLTSLVRLHCALMV